MTEQELKKGIEQVLHSHSWDNIGWNVIPTKTFPEIADQILADIKEADYVKLSPDQSLPANPYSLLQPEYSIVESYKKKITAGWRKIEVKDGS